MEGEGQEEEEGEERHGWWWRGGNGDGMITLQVEKPKSALADATGMG